MAFESERAQLATAVQDAQSAIADLRFPQGQPVPALPPLPADLDQALPVALAWIDQQWRALTGAAMPPVPGPGQS